MTQHYWQGELITDTEAALRLDALEDWVPRVLVEPLNPLVVIAACDRLSGVLTDQDHAVRTGLASRLAELGISDHEVSQTLSDIAAALQRKSLERKLVRELGGVTPQRLARFDFRATVFEAWAPVGLLAHVAPGNAPAAGALSVVEGLLTGNVNIIKASGGDGQVTQDLLAALAAQDPTGAIAARLIVLNFSSSRTEWLAKMCEPADAIAVWGGEEALTGITNLLRPGARLVDWGPKLSFGYLTADTWSDEDTLVNLAQDVCRLDQQACSSPQVIYLDTEDTAELFSFAERFAAVLAGVVPKTEIREPGLQEWAEISNTVLVAQQEQHLGLTKVLIAPDGSWRVLADTRSALQASPLYRTIWVKPLPREKIVATLRPMRRYLQTTGLAASRPDTAVLSRAFFAAGVQRITLPGEMLGGYDGEPHDGVYALQRYSRRIDAQLDERFAADASLDDLAAVAVLPPPPGAVTSKDDFDSFQDGPNVAEVFFRSGGSTGAPKLSMFSWADYHEHMRSGAEGLLAAGFDPRTDRSMNLFFGGRLYGGFSSFFSVLETLEAVQFPMAAQDDHAAVAESIVANGVNTLLGMPSYLLRVFTEGAEVLRRYRGVRKIFYGGEHLAAGQERWLREEFGVELIRSGAYGSVDAGPLGYQCPHSGPRVHHLFTDVQTLEILAMDADRPAAPGETGRLVFSSYTRRGQRLDRYEIGDLGRWIEGGCGCGRRTPRFELLGRFGDIFRIGSYFMNYQRFVTTAQDAFDYAGDVQVVLDSSDRGESLLLRLQQGLVPDDAERAFLAGYGDLADAVERERVLSFAVETVPPERFERTAASGKLRSVVDRRVRNV
ncbi:acyl-CoA reductase [Psychromicrobium sp. YIM B11713]|uniref:acyl-CoA reductase n=1 Tax=Psychromicrobium sp. YIM B11713 TaxID=3145233 RepID=UPI00374EBECC